MKSSTKTTGNITREDNRTVVICDGGYTQPDFAAKDALKHLKKISGDQAALRGDFDILYSPVGKGLGKKSFNPTEETGAFSTSTVLAKAMKGASKRKGVYWVSQYGGSSILTMAMRSLVEERITLPSHLAKLYRPNTSIEEARAAATQLGLKIGDDFRRFSS